MNKFRKFRNYRNKKKSLSSKYILLIMTVICFFSIFFSLVFNISGGPLNTVAGYVFVPMQKGMNEAGNWLSDKVNNFKTLSEVMEENEELKKQVDELTTKLTTNRLEQYELENYRNLLELDAKYPTYEKVAANVVAKDSGNWFDTFTIDRGANDGIKTGMNVISGSGLVGIVTDVGANYAKVRCIINDSNNVSAMITSTQDNIIVSGNLESMNENNVIYFSGLQDDEDLVQVGDEVVTSYVSDQYQQGIFIGYIETIENDSNNLTKSGTIRPVVDFEHIQEVLVILEMKQDKLSDDNGQNSTPMTQE